jgi:predicted nucleic acid-binding protein
VIIDSSCFVSLERRGLPLSAIAEMAPNEDVAIATITVSELLVGVHRADSLERRLRRNAFVQGVFASAPILMFDRQVAEVHAELTALLISSGQRVGTHDLLIAATALTHDHDILTENIRDFQRIPGLTVRQPDWQAIGHRE